MAEEPRLIIRGKSYAYPDLGRLMFNEPPLIEALTGMTHMEFRDRYVKWATSLLELSETEDQEAQIEIDSIVWLGMVATAVSRENPGWSRSETIKFINGLSFDEVEIHGGDAGPPEEAVRSRESSLKNGSEPASTSSSDSDLDSKRSETPPSYGPLTSPTLRKG